MYNLLCFYVFSDKCLSASVIGTSALPVNICYLLFRVATHLLKFSCN